MKWQSGWKGNLNDRCAGIRRLDSRLGVRSHRDTAKWLEKITAISMFDVLIPQSLVDELLMSDAETRSTY
jgi:hypothetical protein